MKGKRKPKTKLHLLAVVWGLIFTIIFLLMLGIKIISAIFEDGAQFFSKLPESFVTWDDPMPYFFIYLIAYAITWWKPLLGSILIILVSIFYVIIAGFDGPPILAAPGLLVGILYLANWIVDRKKQIKAA